MHELIYECKKYKYTQHLHLVCFVRVRSTILCAFKWTWKSDFSNTIEIFQQTTYEYQFCYKINCSKVKSDIWKYRMSWDLYKLDKNVKNIKLRIEMK